MHALSQQWVLNVNDFAKFRGTKGAGVVSKLARWQQPQKFLWILMKNGAGIARAGRICVTNAGGDSNGGCDSDGDAGGGRGGREGAKQTRL